MARTAEEYLALIKRYNPYIEVEGTNLMNELRRRAAENADPYSVLFDSLNYSESGSGIAKEARRRAAPLRSLADQEIGELDIAGQQEARSQEEIANRLKDSIARNYQRRQTESSLDLQRRGLGQAGEAIEANQFLGSERGREEAGVDRELASKLSAISQRLALKRRTASSGIAAQEQSLASQLMAETSGNYNKEFGRQSVDQLGKYADLYTRLLDYEGDIPKDLYEQVRRLIGG